ncbi:MAG: AAA family ATPase [Actinomycetaceae bacterium]|nr:AAA family ATPase [Actinomycetaceae bacterium]
MSEDLLKIGDWFSDRPIWIQTCANWLLDSSDITEDQISALTELCLQEAQDKLSAKAVSFSPNAFSNVSSNSLRLCSIGEIEGVNALAPAEPLNFGDSNLTIVYGYNGSGKSGYIRLLKHICGSREKGKLYGNVFKPSSPLQKACVKFELNGEMRTHSWSGTEVHEDLRSIEIFDTEFGRVFISKENEASYEPPELALFSSLIRVCDRVSARLNIMTENLPSKTPKMPLSFVDSEEYRWYQTLSAATTIQELNKNCSYGDSDEQEMTLLQQRLTEKSPAEKAQQLEKQKSNIEELVRLAYQYLEQLSDNNCQLFLDFKKKLAETKSVAELASSTLFSNSTLEGIGTEVWKDLWEAARKYSISVAYKNHEYPYISDGSRCVLCQQVLTREAKERFQDFEKFIKGELQNAISKAELEYEDLRKTIISLPGLDVLKARVDAAAISPNDFSERVMHFFENLQIRQKLLLDHDPTIDFPNLQLSSSWIREAEEKALAISEKAKQFQIDTEKVDRTILQKRLNSLQARKWLSNNRRAIEEELERLEEIEKIKKGKQLTATATLSKKKDQLAQALITEQFANRFNDELSALGASHLKVNLVKTRTQKGKILHQLRLVDASIGDLESVLSEGEIRIVSIASFLADMAGKKNKAPLIFDDPISSLDQRYEEAVVKRLISLANDRQIIVFTHRLSLLGTFKHYTDNGSLKPTVKYIHSNSRGTGQPAPMPILQNDIRKCLNELITERCKHARVADEEGNLEMFEVVVQSICSDFRVLIERCIENDLLCGIVQRFQRPVRTLKLKELSKLQVDDISFLDALMTKYSGFEHSQPTEAPVSLPSLDELMNDLESLKAWREEYGKRRV